MLIGNGIRLHSNPQRNIFAASSYVSEPGNWHQYGARKNFFISQHCVTPPVTSAWTYGSSILNANDKTNISSWAPTTSADLTAGEVGILQVAFDNITGADGDNVEITSVTDAAGNTWIKAKEQTMGGGGALFGVTVSLWYTKATSTLSSGGAITITFSAATAAKVAQLNRFTITSGATVSVVGNNSEVQTGTDPGSLTVTPSSGSREHLYYRAIGLERAVGSITPTATYTAITDGATAGGVSNSNIYGTGEWLIATNSSSASDPTVSATDSASVMVAFDLSDVAATNTANKSGQPSGTCHPYAWLWPIKAGGMASRNILSGSGTLTGQLYQGVALASDLSGSCTITAGLDLVTALAADLTGTCTITAGLDSTTGLAADLTGTGTVTADLDLIVDMVGALSGSGTITAGLTGTLDLAADITVTASVDFPTVDQIATGVMASVIEAGYDLRDVIALLAARDLGASTGGPTAPAYKGLDGTTTRVTGTVTTDGNRSGITLTPG